MSDALGIIAICSLIAGITAGFAYQPRPRRTYRARYTRSARIPFTGVWVTYYRRTR